MQLDAGYAENLDGRGFKDKHAVEELDPRLQK